MTTKHCFGEVTSWNSCQAIIVLGGNPDVMPPKSLPQPCSDLHWTAPHVSFSHPRGGRCGGPQVQIGGQWMHHDTSPTTPLGSWSAKKIYTSCMNLMASMFNVIHWPHMHICAKSKRWRTATWRYRSSMTESMMAFVWSYGLKQNKFKECNLMFLTLYLYNLNPNLYRSSTSISNQI